MKKNIWIVILILIAGWVGYALHKPPMPYFDAPSGGAVDGIALVVSESKCNGDMASCFGSGRTLATSTKSSGIDFELYDLVSTEGVMRYGFVMTKTIGGKKMVEAYEEIVDMTMVGETTANGIQEKVFTTLVNKYSQ